MLASTSYRVVSTLRTVVWTSSYACKSSRARALQATLNQYLTFVSRTFKAALFWPLFERTIASTLQSSATVASNRAPLEDACEVRVSGLPLSLDTADVATAERILVALNLSRLAPLILKVRTWAPGRSQSAPQATTSSAPSPVLPSVSAMVIRFASPSARATFLEATHRFRTLSLSDIFGTTITETGHLPRPSLRNLSIYMRLTKDSAPTLIATEADLQRFISATHQPIQSQLLMQYHTLTAQHIDLVISNNPSLISDFSVSKSPFAAGHHFISFKYNLSFTPHHADSRSTRPISKMSPSTFNNILKSHIEASLNLESYLNISSTSSPSTSEDIHPPLKSSNEYEAIITRCMFYALDSTAPARLTTFKPRAKPWITRELRDLMRARDRAYRTHRRRATATSLEAYKHLRRLTKNRLDSAKNAHIARELASASSPGGYWRVLRRIGVTARENPSPLKFFTPEELCTYYASVSSASLPFTHDSVDPRYTMPQAKSKTCSAAPAKRMHSVHMQRAEHAKTHALVFIYMLSIARDETGVTQISPSSAGWCTMAPSNASRTRFSVYALSCAMVVKSPPLSLAYQPSELLITLSILPAPSEDPKVGSTFLVRPISPTTASHSPRSRDLRGKEKPCTSVRCTSGFALEVHL
ncbi:unnamed protein product [Trichogramma brassicae]|uniref:Uncharacterized protein n=1 Tax=Trichogramma brassicae TaxID=86971 RepID=A0A6H5IXE7_9HYME|nr:unnamed protein product [Trichogramma brassicae]